MTNASLVLSRHYPCTGQENIDPRRRPTSACLLNSKKAVTVLSTSPPITIDRKGEYSLFCLGSNPFWVEEMCAKIGNTRMKLASKLLQEKHPFLPILNQADILKWQKLVTETLRPFIEIFQEHPDNFPSQKLTFLIISPLSPRDLRPQVECTKEKIDGYVQEFLDQLKKNKTLSLPFLNHNTGIIEAPSFAKGGYKHLYYIEASLKAHWQLVAGISTFDISENGLKNLKNAQEEADLLLKLQGKEGWVQVREVTYRAGLESDNIHQIQQTLVMNGYIGDGKFLLKYLSRYPQHSTEQNIIHMSQTLAKALNILHTEFKLIHQDVKPANILFTVVDGSISVVVADPGLAAPKGRTKGTTIKYAPYEYLQTKKRELDFIANHHAASPLNFFDGIAEESMDVYGLGLIMYQWHLGYNDKHPGLQNPHTCHPLLVEGDSSYTRINKAMHALEQEWFEEPPSKLSLSHLIWRMTHKDRSIRPSSMQEVLKNLEEIHFLEALKEFLIEKDFASFGAAQHKLASREDLIKIHEEFYEELQELYPTNPEEIKALNVALIKEYVKAEETTTVKITTSLKSQAKGILEFRSAQNRANAFLHWREKNRALTFKILLETWPDKEIPFDSLAEIFIDQISPQTAWAKQLRKLSRRN